MSARSPRPGFRLVAPDDVPTPPAERGRLMYTEDVRVEIFRGKKSHWWVTHNVAPEKKIRLGRDTAWWERDVYEWLDEQQSRSA